MIIIGLLIGSFLTYTLPMTVVHNDCKRGDEKACITEDNLSLYKNKE